MRLPLRGGRWHHLITWCSNATPIRSVPLRGTCALSAAATAKQQQQSPESDDCSFRRIKRRMKEDKCTSLVESHKLNRLKSNCKKYGNICCSWLGTSAAGERTARFSRSLNCGASAESTHFCSFIFPAFRESAQSENAEKGDSSSNRDAAAE